MTDLLAFEPIKKFIDTNGKGIEEYFGKQDAAIVALRPDGLFYGEALYTWLQKKGKKNIVFASMEDDAADLHGSVVEGRKVLIVNNDVVTGKSYKRSTEALRLKKKEWDIKDVKFAAYYDRIGFADFSVDKYSAEAIWRFEDLDAVDVKIIQSLARDGREALAEIGKRVSLSSVTIKNRLDRLLKEKVVKIEARLNIDQFYAMSATIYLEADAKTVERLIEKFEGRQEVFLLVRVTGTYNLLIGVLGYVWKGIEEFVEKEIRSESGVKRLALTAGETPILPKTIPPKA
jgi:Lrp/AsnC family transcriptional regulator, leucine-responsive regulatory protein